MYHITGQAVREGADFQDSLDFTAFQGHAAGHDEADVATAEDDDFLTGQIAFHVDHALRCTGRKDASRTITGDTDGTACTFAASHGEDDRLALYFHQAVSRADSRNGLVGIDAEDHGVDEDFDFRFILDQVIAALCVARAGQFFFEVMEAETIVDALLEDAASFAVTFEDENFFSAVLPSAVGSG